MRTCDPLGVLTRKICSHSIFKWHIAAMLIKKSDFYISAYVFDERSSTVIISSVSLLDLKRFTSLLKPLFLMENSSITSLRETEDLTTLGR